MDRLRRAFGEQTIAQSLWSPLVPIQKYQTRLSQATRIDAFVRLHKLSAFGDVCCVAPARRAKQVTDYRAPTSGASGVIQN